MQNQCGRRLTRLTQRQEYISAELKYCYEETLSTANKHGIRKQEFRVSNEVGVPDELREEGRDLIKIEVRVIRSL